MVSSVKDVDGAGPGAVATVSAPAAAAGEAAAEPLPPARSELLRLAARQPGITVAEAARELRLAPNTVSTMVGDLTAQELISRGRSASDGRTVRLTVTARAWQRLAQWHDLRAELTARALAGLDPGDQEALIAAVPALVRLAEQMEEL